MKDLRLGLLLNGSQKNERLYTTYIFICPITGALYATIPLTINKGIGYLYNGLKIFRIPVPPQSVSGISYLIGLLQLWSMRINETLRKLFSVNLPNAWRL